MRNVEKNKSSLFLMELIVAVLFFTAASAVCIKIFFSGEQLSEKSRSLTHATVEVQNVMQLVKGSRGRLDEFYEYYGTQEPVVFFDVDFNVCGEENSKYKLTVDTDSKSDIIEVNAEYLNVKTNEVIFALDTDIYKEAE